MGKQRKEESMQQRFKNWILKPCALYREYTIVHPAHPTLNAFGNFVNTSGKEGEVTYLKLNSPPFQAKEADCLSRQALGQIDGLNWKIALGEYCVRARVLRQQPQHDGAILLVPDNRKKYSAQFCVPLLGLVIPDDFSVQPKDFVPYDLQEVPVEKRQVNVLALKIGREFGEKMNRLSKEQLQEEGNRPPAPKRKQKQKPLPRQKRTKTALPPNTALNPWSISPYWDSAVRGPRETKTRAFATTCRPQTQSAAAIAKSGYTLNNDDDDDDDEGYIDDSSDSEDEEDTSEIDSTSNEDFIADEISLGDGEHIESDEE